MTSSSLPEEQVQILHGDCLDLLPRLAAASVDAVVTDPPYGLEFMGADWDAPWSADPHVGRAWKTGIEPVQMRDGYQRLARPSFQRESNVRCRACGRWQVSSTPCRCPTPDFPNLRLGNMRAYQDWCQHWAAACLRVLKPGGHLLAFAGTRTWHRMVAGIEDAGFEIRDSLCWIYASGFPKSHNIAKAITKINPDLAGRWEGWGTGLKPAHEPIVIARKPLCGTVARNVLAHGVGGLHIDACRIPTTEPLHGGAYAANPAARSEPGWRYRRGGAGEYRQPDGRWPTNLLLTHHPDCADPKPCAQGCPVAELDRQSGPRPAGASIAGTEPSRPFATVYGQMTGRRCSLSYADSGGASRFFPTFRYQPKASRTERPRVGDQSHPTVKPLDLIRWLVRLVTPDDGLVLDLFAGTGTTAEACLVEGNRCILIEREPAFLPLIEARLDRHRSRPGSTGSTA